MTERITIAAPAKINLSLHILGKRTDGFHELETLMVPVRLADEIEITHGAGRGIRLTCNDPDLSTGPDNLCVKAASAFYTATGLDHGVDISLLKKIPYGAGLGGGSSDAAAVLRGMNELFDAPLVIEELSQIAATLGSDVAFFLHEAPALCRGRGEILEDVAPLPDRTLLLVKPPFPIETAWAYKRYAEIKETPLRPVEVDLLSTQWLEAVALVNDLERPVFEKYLLLPVMKSWLRQQAGVESAFMTGSGSTMVAVIAPGTPVGMVVSLKERIAGEFGPSVWMTETGWRK